MIPNVQSITYGFGTITIVTRPEVDPNDEEAQKKRDEEIERMKQTHIELDQQES